MAKSSIIDPEVMAPVQKFTTGEHLEVLTTTHQKCTTGELLQTIAIQLQSDVAEMVKLENSATFLALRIGMNLMSAKAALPHGEFENWRTEAIPELKKTQAYYYHKLAEDFVTLHGLPTEKAVMLISANPEKPGKAKELVQMAFDFLGSKSLNEIFAERGIKKPVENRGGARAGAGRPSLSPADRAAIAQGNWQDIYAKVIQEMKTRSFVYLERAELENLDATLMDLRRDIAEVLNPKGK
jgi:hypothetical protein